MDPERRAGEKELVFSRPVETIPNKYSIKMNSFLIKERNLKTIVDNQK